MTELSLVDVTTHLRRLVSQTDASTPWSMDELQDSLRQHQVNIEWAMLDHDPDFRNYYSRPHRGPVSIQRNLHENDVGVLDFAQFATRVGFYGTDYVLRADRFESAAAHTPDTANVFNGTFTFSTPPDVELFVFGSVYNVYHAAADLLMETPDDGRRPILQWTRGRASDTYGLNEKVSQYRRRGNNLNRLVKRVYRG